MLLILLIPLQAAFAMAMQAKQSDFNGKNLTGNGSSLLGNLTQEDFENMSSAAPPDFTSTDFSSANCEMTYPSAACLVAQDLISLSPDQIRSYGLSDKPDYVVEQTLNILDPGNLTKVLQSISPEEISSIKTVITPEKFDNILSRIPEPQHSELVNIISVPP